MIIALNHHQPISQRSSRNDKKGFTLIEISIVLVIIGLIVGGALVGQDLIRAAELKKVHSNIEQYKVAFHTFRLKYNYLPGEASNARDFFPTASNGNGNKRYDTVREVRQLWLQLSGADLISGDYNGSEGNYIPGTNVPGDTKIAYAFNCAPDTTSFSIYSRPLCYFAVANLVSQPNNYAGKPVVTPNEAIAFDQKYDDGLASSGAIIAGRSQIGATSCVGVNTYASGVTSGTYQPSDLLECIIYFKFNP